MLARVHWEYFSRIPIVDFQLIATNSSSQAPALKEFIERFSRLSEWVASCILAQNTAASQARLFGYLVYIAQLCEQAGNFDVCSAIIAGCTLHEVDRLKRQWKLPEKVEILFKYTRSQIDPSSNYKTYRSILAARLKNSSSPQFVPIVACHLRDLTLTEEANPDRLPDGSINQSKITQLYDTLSIISLAQRRDGFKQPTLSSEAKTASLRAHVEHLRSRGKSWLEARSQLFRPSTSSVDSTSSDPSITEMGADLSDPGSRSNDSDLLDATED